MAVLDQMADLTMEYGFIDESVLLRERAVSLSPKDASAQLILSWSYACAQRWDAAITGFRKVLELEPENNSAQRILGLLLIIRGEPEAAIKIIQDIDSEWHQKIGLAAVYHALGQWEESDAVFAQWLELDARTAPLHVAYTAAFRSDIDLAFEWLYKAATIGPLVSQAAVHPFLHPLHDDPRWIPFLESIGKSPEQLESIDFKLILPE